MNTYKITFERANGSIGFDHFGAETEAQARKQFHEVYRHGILRITKVELVNPNAPATKEQERQALRRIHRILDRLGPNSYIGTALEGCLEIAEENIECDFVSSMKERYESAKEDADHFHNLANTFRDDLEKMRDKNALLKDRLEETETEILRLKARLYDMIKE